MLNMEKARYIYYSNLKVGTQVTIAKRTNILYNVEVAKKNKRREATFVFLRR